MTPKKTEVMIPNMRKGMKEFWPVSPNVALYVDSIWFLYSMPWNRDVQGFISKAGMDVDMYMIPINSSLTQLPPFIGLPNHTCFEAPY